MKKKKIINPKEILFPKVNFDDFKAALERAKPSITKEEFIKYEKFYKEYGQEE